MTLFPEETKSVEPKFTWLAQSNQATLVDNARRENKWIMYVDDEKYVYKGISGAIAKPWTRVTKAEIKQAFKKANAQFSDEDDVSHAEALEIVLIPKIYKQIQMMNKPPYFGYDNEFDLKRVSHPKWGSGYVLKSWNVERDDYNSISPYTVWDGFRRNFVGHTAITMLRIWPSEEEPNDYLLDAIARIGVKVE